MSNYENDYTDETYDRYMLTGEGAEYFEDTYYEEEYIEYYDPEPEEAEEPIDTLQMLDNTILALKQEIKRREKIIKEQKKKERQEKAKTKKQNKQNKVTKTSVEPQRVKPYTTRKNKELIQFQNECINAILGLITIVIIIAIIEFFSGL